MFGKTFVKKINRKCFLFIRGNLVPCIVVRCQFVVRVFVVELVALLALPKAFPCSSGSDISSWDGSFLSWDRIATKRMRHVDKVRLDP